MERRAERKLLRIIAVAWCALAVVGCATSPPTPVHQAQSGTIVIHKDEYPQLMNESGDRLVTRDVPFDPRFKSPPTVIISLTAVDFIDRRNHRLGVRAKDVTARGFTIAFGTWADTQLWSAGAMWLAVSRTDKVVRSHEVSIDPTLNVDWSPRAD